MTGFSDREREFEAEFAHEEELAFRIRTRRNGLLGYWGAEHLGISGPAAHDYALAVIDAQFMPQGQENVVKKLTADFAAKGVPVSESQIRDESHRLLAVAKKQIMAI